MGEEWTLDKGRGSKHEGIRKGDYTFRMVIGKTTGDGEQTSLEIIANEPELGNQAELGYRIMDQRMYQQNVRYLASLEILDTLPVDLAMQVKRCIETAFGRVPLEDRLPPEAYARKETASGS